MRISDYLKRTRHYLIGFVALCALSACSEKASTVDVAADGRAVLKMTAPSFLNTLTSISITPITKASANFSAGD